MMRTEVTFSQYVHVQYKQFMDSLPASRLRSARPSALSAPTCESVRPARPLARPLLLTLLLGGGFALAAAPAQPTDPFLRTRPAAAQGGLSAAQALPVTVFGTPRFSSGNGNTRAVFDLPAGLRYVLTPTYSGLRLDVTFGPGQTQTLAAQHLTTPGSAVSDYNLTPDPGGGGQLLLQTPFPLGGTQGWSASETTLASGGRVLIVTFGATLSGGADSSVSGSVQNIAAPSISGSVEASNDSATPLPVASVQTDQLPPGDIAAPLNSGILPAVTPALNNNADSNRLITGVVRGNSVNGVGAPLLAAPRVGKNPGLTRVVLDLPPGTGFRVTPLPLGLRIDLSGVNVSQLASLPDLTPELRAWSFAPNLTGVSITLLTAFPVTLRSGWRNVLLPAGGSGQLARLALDLSPALADTTPMAALALAPLRSSRNTMLAFSGTPNRPKVVLDPGHGGSDPGAVGQVVEKEVTLAVARRVRADLNSAGIDVIMTRDADTNLAASKNTDLKMRADLGTGVAQLFVSIHVNSMEANAALRGYGIETWWNPNHPNSRALALSLQQDAVAATAAYSRGLYNTQSLAVLRQSRIPAALIEIGYTSHPVDGLNLKDSNYLDRVAYGVASGIRDALQGGLGANWR